jgi:hypothetical protein
MYGKERTGRVSIGCSWFQIRKGGGSFEQDKDIQLPAESGEIVEKMSNYQLYRRSLY